MKFLILALATVFFPGAFADPGKLDLKPLGFPLWGKHGEGDPTDPQELMPGLPDLEGLPAHHLMHALKLHSPPPVPAGPAPLGPSPV
ncbi:hypothetical protein TpMuguga_02g00617 [Theileria parva strain Muguga]|uniref:Uncharacterized protein n=1 Tax=Theileria parva TaxID=5875 RepID=Q4N4M3_THEPA|nr:uncharacterized protein TpMuguga_02g00617 [Theileria parva strain Muguga]EAN32900.1 hypothetical protein TpMuguga_02g00617 [Theileria parva strain Muguga]|eukprot:XP_765183.1 hypothetical protein [Theileria parva strain Muguga]